MIEVRGDLFTIKADAICITTNGFIKKDGSCVMGKGCAKQALTLYPDIANTLAGQLLENGNTVNLIGHHGTAVMLSFPVKPMWREYNVPEDVVAHMRSRFSVGSKVPGWASTAMPQIIKESAEALVEVSNAHCWDVVVIPRPGCGAGGLGWDEVKNILEPILDDRFQIITY